MIEIKEYNFSDLYEMSSGISTKPEQAGHGSPFVSFSTVFNNFFLPDEIADLMDTSAKEQETYSLRSGDILLTRTSETIDELGMSCVVINDVPKATYSGFLKRLRPKRKDVTYPKFMVFYLRSQLFRKTMTNNAVLTLRASLNEEIFSYLKLYLPDYETQKKIGDFLYALSKKIELNNRINAELEAMAKLIYDYWFVQFDFPISKEQAQAMGNPKLEGKPYKASGGKMVWNEELKRKVPEGWGVKSLFDVCSVQYGYPFSTTYFNQEGNGVPVIRIRDIQSNSVTLFSTENNIAKRYLIKKGDLLIGMDGNFHINYWSLEGCYLNQRVVKLTETFLPSIYLKHQVEPFIQLREQSVSRTTVGHLSDKDLKAIQILKPTANVLHAVKPLFQACLDKIMDSRAENKKLSELRDWLLPLLMNGQLKLDYAEDAIPENIHVLAFHQIENLH